MFDRLDWLPTGSHGTVAYYAGQLPGRLLRWLARRPRAPEVIIFPDYDGVGLINYAKLLEACGSPTSFWLMPNWQTLLTNYGSRAVWQNTQADFEVAFLRLLAAGAPKEVTEMCAALRSQGLALEHEAIWLGVKKNARWYSHPLCHLHERFELRVTLLPANYFCVSKPVLRNHGALLR